MALVLSSFEARLTIHALPCSTRCRDEVKIFTSLHTTAYAYTLDPLHFAHQTHS